MGEDMVAVMVRLPGKPGIDRSERSAMQVTVAVTVAGVPTGAAKPLVSTSTRCAVQRTPWCRRLAAAPETPLGSGDGCGPGRFGGGGFDRLPGDRDTPGRDDQQHEQQKRRDADHRLDGGRASLPVALSRLLAHPVVIRSTGTVALCSTIGDQPGMTLNATPRTVTLASVAERLPDTEAFCSTSGPPAAATNDVDAAMPLLAVPVSAPAARAPSCAAAIATVRAW